MNTEALRELLNIRSFEPIEIELSSGQVFTIKHPENAIVMKNTLVVADPDTETVKWTSLIHVVAVRLAGNRLCPPHERGRRCVIMESTLQYVSDPDRCGYLPDRDWRFEYVFVMEIGPAEYNERLEHGWRHFGRTLFRPRCQSCNACQSLRVLAPEFQPNRSQKRNATRNRETVRLRMGAPKLSDARLALFDRYHAFQTVLKGWPDQPPGDMGDYRGHFLDNPFPVEEWRYYLERRLVGVGFVDALPSALSAIYFFYEPAERNRGLGIWNIQCLIEEARLRGLPHVYLGYFVAGCPTMRYKSTFLPHERRQADGSWRPVGVNP